MPGAEALGEHLLTRWSERHRRYHDLRHLEECLVALDHLEGTGTPVRTEVRLAAWFHDAVYAGVAGQDEEDSARLAEDLLTGLDGAGREPVDHGEVARLVRLTATHDPAPDDEAGALNRAWTFSGAHGRPFVTWKLATTLDGRSAAADGTSRWISSRAARLDTHRLRGRCDTMLIGSGTVEVDDPELTVRDEIDQALESQPLRAVMGMRRIAPGRRVLNDRAATVLLDTRSPREALDRLHRLGRHHVLLEGGPTLAAAFVAAGLVDEVVCYVAPMLLGAGTSGVGDLGIATISEAHHLHVEDVLVLQGHDGEDTNVRLTMTPRRAA